MTEEWVWVPNCDCIPPEGDDMSKPWLRECDHHLAQRKALELARGALADIANSDDMTLTVARKKARRIYLATTPNDFKMGASHETK